MKPYRKLLNQRKMFFKYIVEWAFPFLSPLSNISRTQIEATNTYKWIQKNKYERCRTPIFIVASPIKQTSQTFLYISSSWSSIIEVSDFVIVFLQSNYGGTWIKVYLVTQKSLHEAKYREIFKWFILIFL